MSYAVKREIVNRIEAIAAWRRERGEQDQFGFGSDVLARHHRSATGLDDLARHIAAMNDDDPRLGLLVRHAFRGDYFDPGAMLLTEIGRFRFHDPDTDLDAFVSEMITYAEADAAESIELGGKQVAGDNPWRANFEIRIPDDPDEE